MMANRVLLRVPVARALCARALCSALHFFDGSIRAVCSVMMRCAADLIRVLNRRSTADTLFAKANSIQGKSASMLQSGNAGGRASRYRGPLACPSIDFVKPPPLRSGLPRTVLVARGSRAHCHGRVSGEFGRNTDFRRELRMRAALRGRREADSDSSYADTRGRPPDLPVRRTC